MNIFKFLKKLISGDSHITNIEVIAVDATKEEEAFDKLHVTSTSREFFKVLTLGSKVVTSDGNEGILMRIATKPTDTKPYKVKIDGDILKIISYKREDITSVND